jgi:hypothetical protein
LHIAGAVVANPEASQPLEPTGRSFDHRSDPSKTAAVIGASASNDGFDALRSKALPDRLTVVATIRIDRIGMLSRPAGRAAYLRKARDYWQDQFVVAGVRWGGADDTGHAIGIHQQRVFRTEFPAVDRAWPRRISTAKSPHENAVDHRQFGLKDTCLSKDRQEVETEPLPDATRVPPL